MNNIDLLDQILLRNKIDDIGLNLQNSSPSQIIFYNIHNDLRAEKVFLSRFQKGSPGFLVINREIGNLASSDNVYILDAFQFESWKNYILDKFYPRKDKVSFIGVTGTNGKTTVVSLCSQLLRLSGYKCVTLGTLGFDDGNGAKDFEVANTTPSYIDLRKILFKYSNYDFICLEVSSHALAQGRLQDIKLDVSGFTNFSQDHLDYHGSMQEYFKAKLRIQNLTVGHLIISTNEGLKASIEKETLDDNLEYAYNLSFYKLEDKLPPFLKIKYNQENLELVLEMISQFSHIEMRKIKSNIAKLMPPRGRFETLKLPNDALVIIDYAHTPDALENILNATKKTYTGRLHLLFGCGGDRDRSKRPQMGRIAEKYCDFIYITSDNPRFENPEDIINEIISGFQKKDACNLYVNVGRMETIKKALSNLAHKDVLIIAGKGHEEYQEQDGVKTFFSDKKVVKDLL